MKYQKNNSYSFFKRRETRQKLHFIVLNIGQSFLLQYQYLPLDPAKGMYANKRTDEDVLTKIR